MKFFLLNRPVLFIGLFLFYLPGRAQKTAPDSVYSDAGILVSVLDKSGRLTLFDDIGNITARGPLKNGQREGQWELFDYDFDPGNKDFAFVRSTGAYKNGKKEGEWKFYIGNQGYSTGAGWINKKEFFYGYHILTGYYANGLEQGRWTLYYLSNGRTAGFAGFEAGQKKGPWTIDKGLKSGQLLTISPTFLDSVDIKETFDDGGYAMGRYARGKKTGTWQQFDAQNQPVRTWNEGGENTGARSTVNIVLPNLNIGQINRIVFSPNRRFVLLADDGKNGSFRYWLWNADQRKMVVAGYLELPGKSWFDVLLADDGRQMLLYDYSDNPPYTSIYVYDMASASQQMNFSGDGYSANHYFFHEGQWCTVVKEKEKTFSIQTASDSKHLMGFTREGSAYIRQVARTGQPNQLLIWFSDAIVVYDLLLKKEVLQLPCDPAAGVWTDRNFLITGSEKFTVYDLAHFRKVGSFEIPGYDKGKMDTDYLDRYMRFTISPSGRLAAVSFEKNSGFSSPLQVVDIASGELRWRSPMNMGDCDDAFLLVSDSCLVLPRYDKKQDGFCSSQLHWFNFSKNQVLYSTHAAKWYEASSVIQNGPSVSVLYKYPGKVLNDSYNTIDLSSGFFGPLYPQFNFKFFHDRADSAAMARNGKEQYGLIKKQAFEYVTAGKAADLNQKNPQLPAVFFTDLGTGNADPRQLVYYAYDQKASYENKTVSGQALTFWNGRMPTEAQRKVSLQVMDNGEYIFYSPDRYYMGSKNIRRQIYFEKDLQLYPFEQFDLKYNRPDIVLSRLGYADSALVKACRNAYLKRLKKMHFTEDMLKDDAALPGLIIKNAALVPAQIQGDSLELDLEIKDSRFGPDRINIWINDVPVYGTNGIPLRGSGTFHQRLQLQLAHGHNKIQVSVLNKAGIESLKETIYTEAVLPVKKPDLYLVTIGAGEYADARYNLRYAAKDALDITTAFAGAGHLYNRIHTRTLTDKAVTLENMESLKTWLQQAGRNDVVLISVSGHGVLDAELNYYLASHPMDFEQPAAKGIPYEKLEDLLDGIKPIKKLLLIDACHSGEIDREEVQLAEAQKNTLAQNVAFRSVGPAIEKKHFGFNNSTSLVYTLFSDLRRGTGAQIISSASGVELAMESDAWKNGLFTYCLLQGLTQNRADLDHDGKIMVSELQRYLSQTVAQMSQGNQQPTYRIENTEADFRIW